MVEGTGLENQRRKRPQVRILSFPPKQSIVTPTKWVFLLSYNDKIRTRTFGANPVLSAKTKGSPGGACFCLDEDRFEPRFASSAKREIPLSCPFRQDVG